MKKLIQLTLVLFAISASVVAQDAKISWMTFDEALKAQKNEPKKIFMDVYTNWCGPCKMMDKNTFSHPKVAAYLNENYYPVKFNAEGDKKVKYQGKSYSNSNYDPKKQNTRNYPHDFTMALGIQAYPTIAFFDETGKFIQPIPGYRSPKDLEIFLKLLAGDDYKNITTKEQWEDYQENFEYTFE
ncbi:MAG: thioredoxin fold domain-containing protein [Leeuwenhoekiella sp.]